METIGVSAGESEGIGSHDRLPWLSKPTSLTFFSHTYGILYYLGQGFFPRNLVLLLQGDILKISNLEQGSRLFPGRLGCMRKGSLPCRYPLLLYRAI